MPKKSKKQSRLSSLFGYLKKPLYGLLILVGTAFLLISLVIVLLRWLPPPTSAFMLQDATAVIDYRWTPMEKISPWAALAAVAAEDQKFPHHHGFDTQAIVAAFKSNLRGNRRRGGSTISQQTAKNLFLWRGGGYIRKLLEAGLTAMIELFWPKERILEVYLNIAEFGPGIYGISEAAKLHFGRPASTLTLSQAARLAATLPNPNIYEVHADSGYVARRSAWIEQQMQNLGLGYIDFDNN